MLSRVTAVIAVDLTGHGKGKKPAAGITLRLKSSQLLQVLAIFKTAFQMTRVLTQRSVIKLAPRQTHDSLFFCTSSCFRDATVLLLEEELQHGGPFSIALPKLRIWALCSSCLVSYLLK